MAKRKKEKTKEERIRDELRRLTKIYADIEEKKKATVEGLIQRVAYMRITLDDFEKDLDENGYVEWFQQGEKQDPYERKRPVADIYNSMNNSYQKAVKQLTDLLPKQEPKPQNDDGFDDFVTDREDV